MVTNEEIRNRLVLAIKNTISDKVPITKVDQYASIQFDKIAKVYPKLLDAEYLNNKYFTTYRIDAMLSDIEYNYMSKYCVKFEKIPVMIINDTNLKMIKSEIRSLIAANKDNVVKGK